MATATRRKLPYKPRVKGPERRALIEDAAARLFAENGYDATSLEDVASAAGVSRPVIYDHYRSKAELHAALAARHARELMVHVAGRVESAEPGLEPTLRAGFDGFFEFMQADPYAWRMVMTDPLRSGSATVLDPRVQNEVTAGIAALIEHSATEQGVDIGPPERLTLVAESMRWMTTGLASWWYEHPEVPRETLVETVMELCWTGLERVAKGERP